MHTDEDGRKTSLRTVKRSRRMSSEVSGSEADGDALKPLRSLSAKSLDRRFLASAAEDNVADAYVLLFICATLCASVASLTSPVQNRPFLAISTFSSTLSSVVTTWSTCFSVIRVKNGNAIVRDATYSHTGKSPVL